jgi:hypothetical protein
MPDYGIYNHSSQFLDQKNSNNQSQITSSNCQFFQESHRFWNNQEWQIFDSDFFKETEPVILYKFKYIHITLKTFCESEWMENSLCFEENICTKQFSVPNTFKQMKVVYLHTLQSKGGKKKDVKKFP